MDPNATLNEMRRLACTDDEIRELTPREAYRLAELVAALDAWMVSGGFPPTDWDPRRIREQARNSR